MRLDEITRRDELLARHTTIKIGAAPRWFALPNSEDELVAVLEAAKSDGVRVQNLGGGSNTVPNDAVFDGLILKLGAGFAYQRIEGGKLVAGGAALLPFLTKFAVKNRLGNFEWACGIPGAVGGSIWGNAGSRGFNGREFEGRDAAADLESVTVFDRNARKRVLEKRDLEFAYRRSSIGDLIITEATFALKPLGENEAKTHAEAVRELLRLRRESQPVSAASAGCAWKNPKSADCASAKCASAKCASAGQLIEQMGLKSFAVGGAKISEIHGNFVINASGASGANVRQLLQAVENRVLEERGIALEREIRLLD